MFSKGLSHNQMSKLNAQRSVEMSTFSQAKNAIFVFDGFDQLKFNSIQLFVENVRQKNANFKPFYLFFINENEPKPKEKGGAVEYEQKEFHLDFVFPIFKNHFGFGTKIKNERNNELLASKFEMAVLVESEIDPLLQSFYVQINSKLKIGVESDFNKEFCDFIVSATSSDSVIDRLQLMNKYLEMLG